jgi:hypothetical protein
MNEIVNADYAHQITNEIIALRRKGDVITIEITIRLKEVRDKILWQIEGDHSFFAYLARPEIAFDRTTVLKWIQIYETFIEQHSLAPVRVEEIGVSKLAMIVPYIKDENYEYMVELAENNSRSDIGEELVRQKYITKKEFEPEVIECPFCFKKFTRQLRKESHYPQEDYNRVIKAYEDAKETKFKGKEYDPLVQSIRTMFFNGHIPDQIIKAIEWMKDNAEYEWTLNTLKNKIPEVLSKIGYKPKKEMSESDLKLLKGVGLR